MKKYLLAILSISILIQCSKEKINVSNIYPTDHLGNLMGNTPNDNQWKNVEYTSSELDLFNELDTANLLGTQLPVINTSYYGFPNPFTSQIRVVTSLIQPLNGEIILKYAIVNEYMNSVQKGSARLYIGSSIAFTIQGNFKSGNYRLYFTYSSQGHDHFFKTWGNIKKM